MSFVRYKCLKDVLRTLWMYWRCLLYIMSQRCLCTLWTFKGCLLYVMNIPKDISSSMYEVDVSKMSLSMSRTISWMSQKRLLNVDNVFCTKSFFSSDKSFNNRALWELVNKKSLFIYVYAWEINQIYLFGIQCVRQKKSGSVWPDLDTF